MRPHPWPMFLTLCALGLVLMLFGFAPLAAQAPVTETPTPSPSPTATPIPLPHVWQQMGLAGHVVRDLAIRPDTPRILLAATLGDGVGAYLTEDDGQTWRAANNGLADPDLYQLAQEPSPPWVVYAASLDRLWKTTDGGLSWRHVVVQEAPLSRLSGLAAAPNLPGRLYLTAWEPCSVIFVSNDGGESWERRPSPELCAYNPLDSAFAVWARDAAIIYLARAHDRPEIYYSADGGIHWARKTDIAGGLGVNDLALDPTDSLHLYAATWGGGVWVTRDGGETWSGASYGLPGNGTGLNVTALALDPAYPNVLYAAAEGYGVYRSGDGGARWYPLGEGLPADLTIYALRLAARRPGQLWAATSDGVWTLRAVLLRLPLIYKQGLPMPPATPTPESYPYPWPSATPTPSATPSPGLSPTPTVTPSVTPSPTPLGGVELLVNGDFEGTGGWRFGNTVRSARYTTAVRHGGVRGLQAGIVPPEGNALSDSSVYQSFTIPANALSATLRLWCRRHTEERPLWATDYRALLGLPALAAEEEIRDPLAGPQSWVDWQEVLLLDGINYRLVRILERSLVNDGDWRELVFDLSADRGRTLAVYVNVRNDGLGGRTWMYVDDVSVRVVLP